MIAYGLARRRGWRGDRPPADPWMVAELGDDGQFVLVGDLWEVIMLTIQVDAWPTAATLAESTRRLFEALLAGGCRIAWLGAEGLPFCDPPELFDPGCMSGGVLAWMTTDGVFECPLDPDRALKPVADSHLREMRDHAGGLADAT